MFKRGNIATDLRNGMSVIVLGPEDFDGYERNRPNDRWELVRYPDGTTLWTGNEWITKMYDLMIVRRLR